MEHIGKADGGRILVLDHASDYGGGQTVLMQILAHFDQIGAEYRVALPRDGCRFRQLMDQDPNRVIALPAVKPNQLNAVWDLNSALWSSGALQQRGLKLYVNGTRAMPSVLLRVLGGGVDQIAVHLHLALDPKVTQLLRILLRLHPCVSLICCSEFIFEDARRRFPDADVHLLENALSADFTKEPVTPVRRARKSPLRVAIVGGVEPTKGQDALLSLPMNLWERLQFHLIGPDRGPSDWHQRLRSQAPPNTVFAGPHANVPNYYAAHQIDTSVVTSRVEESFGLAAVEGMALGTATAVRSRGNLTHIAENTGALRFSTDQELHKQLRALLSMPADQFHALRLRQQSATLAQYDQFRIGAVLSRIGFLSPHPQPKEVLCLAS